MLPGVGVLGSGSLARFLIPVLRSKGFPIEGVWGFQIHQIQSLADELDIPFFTDSIDTLLLKKEVQLIVVVCPPHLHSTIVSKAFNVGKHVLCDWTAALTANEMKEMVERATYYPSLISILCHPLRFLVSCQQMKILMTSSFIGQVTLIEANVSGEELKSLGNLYSVNCDQFMGGGILPTVASHFIDIISFLTNTRAKRVNGILRKLSPDPSTPSASSPTSLNSMNNLTNNLSAITFSRPDFVLHDYCQFQMELQSRDVNARTTGKQHLILATVTINSSFRGPYRHDIKVYGTNGSLTLRFGNLYGRRFSRAVESPSKKITHLNANNNITKDKMKGDQVNHNHDEEDEELLFSEEVDQGLVGKKDLSVILPLPYDQGLCKLIGTLSHAFNADDESNASKNNTLKSDMSVPVKETGDQGMSYQTISDEHPSMNGTDSSYSSATSSLNSADFNTTTTNASSSQPSTIHDKNDSPLNKTNAQKMNEWFKDAVSLAANFEDGQYIRAVMDAIKESSERREWIRVRYNTPFSVGSPAKQMNSSLTQVKPASSARKIT